MQEPSSNVCHTVDNNNQHNNAFTHTRTYLERECGCERVRASVPERDNNFCWLSERGFLAKNWKK